MSVAAGYGLAVGAGELLASSGSSGPGYAPAAPTANPGETYANVLQDQVNLAPQQLAAEQQYDPQYAALYQSIIQNNLMGTSTQPGLLSLYSQAEPQLGTIQNAANTQQLQGNLANLQNLGGSAVSAFQSANPQLQNVQNAIVGQAMNTQGLQQIGAQNPLTSLGSWNAPQMTVNPTQAATAQLGWNPQMAEMQASYNPSLSNLSQTANQQLAMGGALPSQTTSDISNQVLSSMNTMGRAADPAAAANLALSLNSNQQAMLQQRENMVGQVAGLQQGQSAQQLQAQGLGLSGASTQAGFAQQSNLANQQNIYQSQLANQQGYINQQGLTLQGATQNAQLSQQAQMQNVQNYLSGQALQSQILGGANSALMGTTMPALGTVLSPSTTFGNTAQLYGQAGSTGTGASNFNYLNAGTSLYSNQYNDQYGVNGINSNNAGTSAGYLNAGLSTFGSLMGMLG